MDVIIRGKGYAARLVCGVSPKQAKEFAACATKDEKVLVVAGDNSEKEIMARKHAVLGWIYLG